MMLMIYVTFVIKTVLIQLEITLTKQVDIEAFNICNLNYKQQTFIPVIFHNGKGYDFNLLFNEIFKQKNSRRRNDILPSTNGKAKLFRVGILKFIDSYIFLTMSLD